MPFKNTLIKTNAKINFGLKVLDTLPDGYHSICTIMQEIDFYDIIEIEPTRDKKINLSCFGPVKLEADEKNLCHKAAKLIYENYNCSNGIHIKLNKNIPIGAGLGGGSSNAAGILKTLNQLFNLKINNSDLTDLALTIGCDVPFFINGGIQLCEGKGEILTPLKIDLSQYYILLVLPNFSISTSWAYSFFKNDLCKTFDSNKFRSFQHSFDWKLFENDFEKVVNLTYPEIDKIRSVLENKKALLVSLSGSGSTMFGVFKDFLKADIAYQQLKNYNCHIVKPLKRN